jgi:hypothetical protein
MHEGLLPFLRLSPNDKVTVDMEGPKKKEAAAPAAQDDGED